MPLRLSAANRHFQSLTVSLVPVYQVVPARLGTGRDRQKAFAYAAEQVSRYNVPIDPAGAIVVKDQVHIRNAEAAQLARTLARQTGKTIDAVVLDALRQYRPARRGPAPQNQLDLWRRLLRGDRKRGMAWPGTPVEALYDEATGLPA